MPERLPTHLRLPIGLSALFALLIVLFLVAILGLSPPLAAILAISAALIVAAWAVIRLRKEKEAHQATLARWAVAEAVSAERLRIARDLHDIVSHGLGLITVRAAAAKHLQGQDPSAQALLEAIEDVESLSRQATLELRRMLAALRDGSEPAPRHPVDDLKDLPEIIAAAQQAGLRVTFSQGELGEVSPGAQAAICAIVREGLANCSRHAGPTRVQVFIRREQNLIAITMTDDGPGSAWAGAPGAGHGLLGLRERVHSLGGVLKAEPVGAGFRLDAVFPDEPK